jgi:hypothetical protein
MLACGLANGTAGRRCHAPGARGLRTMPGRRRARMSLWRWTGVVLGRAVHFLEVEMFEQAEVPPVAGLVCRLER